MSRIILAFVLALCAAFSVTDAFVTKSRFIQTITAPSSETSLYSCRRNNKREKRKRNKEYSRKFKSATGGARKKVVVEQKRQVVSSNEDSFQAGVFKMTTDEDMPAYSGFDFI